MARGHDRSLSTLEKERPDALLVLGHPLILFRRGQRLRGFHAPAVSANCDSGHDHITLVALLVLASARVIFASKRSNSNGLVSQSSQPAASAFSRSLTMACAVRAMMGMSRVAGSALSRRVASQPSTTGRSRSMRMRSGRSLNRLGNPFGSVHRGDHLVPAERFE